jgi:DNA topoisomerase VI subunit B
MMAGVAALERTTFRTSRLLEFCSRKELVAQTGHEPDAWPLVVLKELIDNALDACEEAGIAPEIRIKLTNSSITVTDNGPGIAPEAIASIMDFTTRTSSREAYVSPTRGAQGNALKTIFAMPFVLDGAAGRVGIISRGIRQKITFKVDHIRQEPVIDQARHEVTRPVRNGCSITVAWPVSACSALQHERSRILQLANACGFINPHLRLTIVGAGSRDTEPSDRAWQKWKPCDPTSPHWYQPDHLERLIGAYLSHDAEHGRERTVREFIAEFRGLSGTAKQKSVLDATALARAPLSRLLNGANAFDRQAVGSLLQAMAANSKPVRPEALGIIGEDHLRAKFEAAGCAMDSFRCKAVKGSTDGVPWIIEAAFAWRPAQDGRAIEDGGYTKRQLITGVNWSPGIVNPFRSLGYGRGLESLLAEKFAGPQEPVVVLVHLACPRVTYTDRGKSAIVVNSRADADALLDAVTAVTRVLDPPAQGGAARPIPRDQSPRRARPAA